MRGRVGWKSPQAISDRAFPVVRGNDGKCGGDRLPPIYALRCYLGVLQPQSGPQKGSSWISGKVLLPEPSRRSIGYPLRTVAERFQRFTSL